MIPNPLKARIGSGLMDDKCLGLIRLTELPLIVLSMVSRDIVLKNIYVLVAIIMFVVYFEKMQTRLSSGIIDY